MALRLGIGVVTYNRKDLAARTVDCVRRFTNHAPAELVVADDGSTDLTAELFRARDVCCVTGPNRGIAWNKNRALYMLSQILNCDVTILLEDDTSPAAVGWETEWIAAALRWGHVGFAAPWIRHSFLSGSGTAADPIVATAVTAQCAAWSRAALLSAGYFDSRFTGYGEEHMEHTMRLIRHGFGGTLAIVDGVQCDLFYLLRGALTIADAPGYFNDVQVDRNRALARELSQDIRRREPWQDQTEKTAFTDEISAALTLTPPMPLKPVTFL